MVWDISKYLGKSYTIAGEGTWRVVGFDHNKDAFRLSGPGPCRGMRTIARTSLIDYWRPVGENAAPTESVASGGGRVDDGSDNDNVREFGSRLSPDRTRAIIYTTIATGAGEVTTTVRLNREQVFQFALTLNALAGAMQDSKTGGG